MQRPNVGYRLLFSNLNKSMKDLSVGTVHMTVAPVDSLQEIYMAPRYECCMSGHPRKDTPESNTNYGTRRLLHEGLNKDSLENNNMDCSTTSRKVVNTNECGSRGGLEKCVDVALGGSDNRLRQ